VHGGGGVGQQDPISPGTQFDRAGAKSADPSAIWMRGRPQGRPRFRLGGNPRYIADVRIAPAYRLCALWLLACAAALCVPQGAALSEPAATGAPPSAAAMEKYRRDLAAYMQAWEPYQAAAKAYWASVAEKRRMRFGKRARGEPVALDDYVPTQPPVYSGPPKPIDPSKPPEPTRGPSYVPVVADFLAAALKEFKFTPRAPRSESEFKRAYVAVAAAAGLTNEQVARIYGFEASGDGAYDVQAGLEYSKSGRAITTALGYNQLLATNSVELMAEDGDHFLAVLAAAAVSWSSDDKKALESRLAIARKMIAFAKSVPDDWSQHEVLAGTPKGLAIHALNLDIDFGPLLQTQKLLDSVIFARRKGFAATLTAAELEMMNLTGDGNGFDMVTMPAEWRDKVPTSNFFQASGYSHNPVAQRNNVVSALIAATNAVMDREVVKPGARELAAAFR
jgi:hypothetical protein